MNLSYNSLSGTSGDDVARAVGGLEEVNLSWNSLGNRGAMLVGKAIQGSSTLRTVGLGSNSVHSRGVMVLLDCVTQNTTVNEIDLSCNPIGEKGLTTSVSAQYWLSVGSLQGNGVAGQYYGCSRRERSHVTSCLRNAT